MPEDRRTVDQILDAAGSDWRAVQPAPRAIEASLFATDRARVMPDPSGRLAAFLAGAATATVALVVLALAVNLAPRPGIGNAATGAAGNGYIPGGKANCPLTRPDGSFRPDPEPGADFAAPDGEAWYGSPFLWTLLNVDGEVWEGLPRSELGLSQKTFWWRHGYQARIEQRPEIYVTGDRLDGSGRFGFGPGTNASFGLGSAMLVGVEVPESGCWKVTARYGSEALSYVVWVGPSG